MFLTSEQYALSASGEVTVCSVVLPTEPCDAVSGVKDIGRGTPMPTPVYKVLYAKSPIVVQV